MTPETIILITGIAGGTMFLVGGGFIGLTIMMRPRMALKRRMNDIGVIGDSSGGGGGQGDKSETRRQKRIQDKVKQLESKSSKQSRREAIRANILQAGLDFSLTTYFVFSAIVGCGFAMGYLMTGKPPIGAAPVALIGGLLFPHMVLKYLAGKRQAAFTKNFANALDLIVRGIRSGLPVNECFNVVAREFEPPVGEEFRLLVEGQNLGMTMDDLLSKGIQRIPTSEYKFFAIVLEIQRQTGGNLAETLAGLSAVLRDRKKMRDKARAMASEATASAGIIGSLPFAVGTLLSVVNPDYVGVLFTTDTGNKLVAFGLFWMFLGSMVMKKMINFKM